MKQITTNGKTLIFVPMPEDANEITLTELGRLDYMTNGGMDYTMLPSGNYRFIATTDTITEEQAMEFVKRKDNGMYIDYLHYGEPYHNAVTSFKSLLQQHSITGRHAIIEQI